MHHEPRPRDVVPDDHHHPDDHDDHHVRRDRRARDERGLTTAELLGNAALGVLALVVIWAALQQLGLDIVDWIRDQVIG